MFRSVERRRSDAPRRPPSPRTVPLTGFRADVQALRGVAVLAVVLYHAQVVFPGGYVGFDVFFVLSGFVIGRVLVKEFLETGRLAFVPFYVRRARRLLPALSVLLLTVVLLTPLIGPLGAQDVTPRTAIAAALFHANAYLYGATEEGYFTADAELNPLLHTWSLSVEEQFYFAVPVLLVLAWRLGRRRGWSLAMVRGTIAAMAVASLTLSLVASYRDVAWVADGLQFAFYAPFTRAWQFAAGLALVVLPLGALAGPRLRRVAVVLGAAGLLTALLAFDAATTFPGLAALLPTAATALIIYGGTTADGQAAAARRPALVPLIWIGDLSYSWYLWHWPFIVFARAAYPEAGWTPLVVGAALSLAPAWLSFRTLEHRLRLRPGTPRRRTAVLVASCLVVPLGAAAAVPALTDGAAERMPIEDFTLARAKHGGSTDACDVATPLHERDPSTCLWDFSPAGGAASGATPVEVLLIGDSNAGHFSEALIEAARIEQRSVRVATLSGCRFAVAEDRTTDTRSSACREFVDGSMAAIEADPPELVVIANATDHTIFVDEDERAAVIRDGIGEPEGAARYAADFARAIDQVERAGSEVAILATVPKATGWDGQDCSRVLVHLASDRCLPDPVASDNRVVTLANALERQVAADTGASLWTLNDELCPAGACGPVRGGAWFWRDGSHISVAAAEQLGPAVAEELAATLP